MNETPKTLDEIAERITGVMISPHAKVGWQCLISADAKFRIVTGSGLTISDAVTASISRFIQLNPEDTHEEQS